jgi:type II secretory pathway pseudopilin PulG
MRHGGLKSQITNHKLQMPQRGYMMITLMLALALITIAMLAVLPGIKQQIMRDREEEMVHRGTEYMRAIQHFYKKFNRYPNRVEELENTNNLRFIRKRYTDPMNIDRSRARKKTSSSCISGHQPEQSGRYWDKSPGQSWTPGTKRTAGTSRTRGPASPSVGQLGSARRWLQQTGGVQNLNGDSGNSSSGSSSVGSASGNSTDSSGSTSGIWFQSKFQFRLKRADVRRRTDTGSRQHKQSQDHPRVLRQEPLQRLALCLPADGRPGRHTDRACESWYAHSELKRRRSRTAWSYAGTKWIWTRWIRARWIRTGINAKQRSKPRSSNANSADSGAGAPAVDLAFPAPFVPAEKRP